MSDDELGGELDRVLRVALTAGGQLAERVARSRADRDRAQQAAAGEAQHAAERQIARHIEAGRAVYGAVREPQLWEQPNAQRRLGEALVAAEALRDIDPVAVPAAQYLHAEARRRHGVDGGVWLAAAVQAYLDELSETADRDPGLGASVLAKEPAAEQPAVGTHQPTPQTALPSEPERTVEQASPDLPDAAGPSPAAETEHQVAAHAFPEAAAAQVHRRRPSRRAPAARRTPQRERSHDRGR